MDEHGWSARERGWAVLVAVGVVGAALVPMRQFRRPIEQRVDSFPLSHFPMFSQRLEESWRLSYPVGVHRDGSRRTLPYFLLGAGGVNQVRKQLFRAVRRGQAQEHAQRLAQRLARRPDCGDVVRVEIVRGEFELDTCLLQGETTAAREEVLAGADVPGRSAVDQPMARHQDQALAGEGR